MGYGGGMEFWAGDFYIRDGKARCGGFAADACREGSQCGFTSEIVRELNWSGVHYYAILSRDGESFRVERSNIVSIPVTSDNNSDIVSVFIVDAGGVREITNIPFETSEKANSEKVLVARAQR